MKKVLLYLVITLVAAGAAIAQNTTGTSTPSPAATASATAAPKTDTAKKPPVFRPNKDQIKEVQSILKTKKLYSGEPSGKYDDDTRTGIKSFQKDNGLKDTGTLNRATLEKFGVALTDKQKEIPVSASSLASSSDKASSSSKSAKDAKSTDSVKKPAVFRANVDQIKAAQKMLKGKSLYTGDESGKLDDATRDALKKYQDANGIKVTGTLNALTLEKMGIQLTDKQKESSAPAKN